MVHRVTGVLPHHCTVGRVDGEEMVILARCVKHGIVGAQHGGAPRRIFKFKLPNRCSVSGVDGVDMSVIAANVKHCVVRAQHGGATHTVQTTVKGHGGATRLVPTGGFVSPGQLLCICHPGQRVQARRRAPRLLPVGRGGEKIVLLLTFFKRECLCNCSSCFLRR